jgi:hypothetical protein
MAKLAPKKYGDKPVDEAPQQALTFRWLDSSDPAMQPPQRPQPPRQITYQKPELPADLIEQAWSVLVDLLEMVRRSIPTNSDKPPEKIFGVMKAALLAHFREQ